MWGLVCRIHDHLHIDELTLPGAWVLHSNIMSMEDIDGVKDFEIEPRE